MVKFRDLVDENKVYLEVCAESRKIALEEITQRMVQAGLLADEDRPKLFQLLFERETLCSTGVGFGVAIPHAYFEKLSRPMVVFARLKKPVDYCSPDEKPVDLVFILLGPKRDPRQHIQILSKIVRMVKDKKFDQELRTAKTTKDALKAMLEVENRHH